MNVRSPKSRKKYSARSLAAGSAFCPACRKLTDRNVAVCPACGFRGEHTMAIFPLSAPPLEEVCDHAGLFGERGGNVIRRALQPLKKRFPQIHWKVVTADLPDGDNPGLFAFWLLNVSPPGAGERIEERRWTVLIVIMADGEIAVVPGYSVEPWLSGQDWTQLIRGFRSGIRRKGVMGGLQGFLNAMEKKLENSWLRMRAKLKKRKHRKEVKP